MWMSLFQQRRFSEQTENVEPMLLKCWPTVYDTGPALNQQCVNFFAMVIFDSIFDYVLRETDDR